MAKEKVSKNIELENSNIAPNQGSDTPQPMYTGVRNFIFYLKELEPQEQDENNNSSETFDRGRIWH